DSYAAGTGVDPLVAGSKYLCQQSARNLAHLIAQRRSLPLTDVSCAGAQTAHLSSEQYYGVGPQLDALGSATRLVTLMLGGNDARLFGGAVAQCSDAGRTDPTGSPCRTRYGDALAAPIRSDVEPALVDALRAVRARAPRARVFIIGYPWILPRTGGCYPAMQIAAGDVGYLRDLQAQLNAAIRRAAQTTGVTYVDMSRRSDGHDACAGPDRWIEPQIGSTSRITVHPNARGQQALADAVLARR
ncbi:MAG: SGNH/GDSL hydrolase family protein, partial [Gordonia sp. (in: high G+C Gram-positive bacteria)]